MAEPFDQFAERIVRNDEFHAVASAIGKAGGKAAVQAMVRALEGEYVSQVEAECLRRALSRPSHEWCEH